MSTSPLEARWRAFVEDHHGAPPLDRAAARLAVEEGSPSTVDALLARVDALARGARAPAGAPLEERLARLVHHLFAAEGFHGDEDDYEDPRNSRLDAVLDRRRGLPITLSILTIAVGARVGLELDPVGFPGHFLVATRGDPPLYLDPFQRGRRFHREVLEARLTTLLGRPPAPDERDRALGPTATVDVILRMSNNLVQHWLKRGDLTGALRSAERRVAVRPDLLPFVRDRGLLRARLGLRRGAAADLQRYLAEAPGAADAARVAMQLSMVLQGR